VVPEDPEREPDGRALEARLGRKLPSYMVPRQWVRLSELPLNPNGKVDRAALPDPADSSRRRPRVAPRDAEEEELVRIWTDLLGHEPGVEDDFFELGGHSLAATRLLSTLRERFGVEISVHSFFETPRIEALAEKVRASRDRSEPPPEKIGRVRRGTGDLQQLLNLVDASASDETG
jgi:nonribosomal peptide synthetase DhbF